MQCSTRQYAEYTIMYQIWASTPEKGDKLGGCQEEKKGESRKGGGEKEKEKEP